MTPRFLLDGMLGGLSRWLRIIGYDTLYYPDKEDTELSVEAEVKNRILVTRDAELHRQATKRGIKTILIHSDQTIEQLREITEKMELGTIAKNTRCPRCNGVLREIEKNSVKDKVPEESFNAFYEFWICADCDAVYWKGSHWIQIQDTLKKIEGSKSL